MLSPSFLPIMKKDFFFRTALAFFALLFFVSFSSLKAEVLSFDSLSLSDQTLVLNYYTTQLGENQISLEEVASLFNSSTEEEQNHILHSDSLSTTSSSSSLTPSLSSSQEDQQPSQEPTPSSEKNDLCTGAVVIGGVIGALGGIILGLAIATALPSILGVESIIIFETALSPYTGVVVIGQLAGALAGAITGLFWH